MAHVSGPLPAWRTSKREVIASQAVVASNHPLASAAGIEVLCSGGNAVDAAVATLFALSVVEPMMVSPFGAGFFLICDGRSGEVSFIDNYASVPALRALRSCIPATQQVLRGVQVAGDPRAHLGAVCVQKWL